MVFLGNFFLFIYYFVNIFNDFYHYIFEILQSIFILHSLFIKRNILYIKAAQFGHMKRKRLFKER
jgi:hypothetical protein